MNQQSFRSIVMALSLLVCGLLPGQAAWAQAKFSISACNITVNSLIFGTYEPTAASDINTSVVASCTIARATGNSGVANPPVSVALGSGSSGAASQRTLAQVGGSGTLNYNLFTASNYQTIWGEGGSGSSTPAVVRTFSPANAQSQSLSLTFDIFGRIPAQQLNVRPGSYADTVPVTVIW